MIEVCSLKRIIFVIVFLIGSCLMILTLESILSSHNPKPSSFNSSENCWEREEYTIKQKCSPCTQFERVSQHIPVCIQYKYKEMIACKISGDVYRRCDTHLEQQKFWIFESSVAITGIIGALTAILRQKHLDRKMTEKIQQQISAGV